MGFFKWLQDTLGNKPINEISPADIDEYVELTGDIYIREMAFWHAVNLITNTVVKYEFRTYERGKESKGKEYYLWNIEPNKNQNAKEFMRQLIARLYRRNECLVVEVNGELYIAESFMKRPYALFEDVFEQVTLKGITFQRAFTQSEVLYFTLADRDIRKILTGLYDGYSKLIAYSMKMYQRSRGTKGKFTYKSMPPAGTEQRERFDKLVNERMSKWLSSDTAALPLGEGQDFVELEKKTYASDTTRDIRALIDDVSDFTAKAFLIPPSLLRGTVQNTSSATDQFLTFCIDPLVELLAAEINRKRSGYKGISEGTYLRIDTKTTRHIELLSAAGSLDKLIASGIFCLNDALRLLGEPIIDEPWAWQHWMTKNYATADEALGSRDERRGEKDE